jgi:hypothetical protein
MTTDNTKKLAEVLEKYAVPDPKIVSKLPKGGTTLDFVGHADITRILIEIDPLWSWEPVAWSEDGRPAITVTNGMATMWARLTLCGKSVLGVGSVRHDKMDVDKELIGDFLRNAAMRFGISLNLWTKNEWEDLGGTPKIAPRGPIQRPMQHPVPPQKPQKPNQNVVAPIKKPDNVQNLPTVEGSISRHPSSQPSKAQIAVMEKTAKAFGDPLDVITDILGKPVTDLTALTGAEVKDVINNLNKRKEAQ